MKIETYTLPDGTVEHGVYIEGTNFGSGEENAWSNASNLDLYLEHRASASYQAVVQAMHDAGVQPGDGVHIFGHSQGAMVGQLIAQSDEFAVRTVVSFGSPVDVQLPETVLGVTVRHLDDAVAGLAGGGLPGTSGAPGSVVIETIGHEQQGLIDLTVAAHHLHTYEQTAARIDAAANILLDDARAVFTRLGTAVSVEAREYTGTRVTP